MLAISNTAHDSKIHVQWAARFQEVITIVWDYLILY